MKSVDSNMVELGFSGWPQPLVGCVSGISKETIDTMASRKKKNIPRKYPSTDLFQYIETW